MNRLPRPARRCVSVLPASLVLAVFIVYYRSSPVVTDDEVAAAGGRGVLPMFVDASCRRVQQDNDTASAFLRDFCVTCMASKVAVEGARKRVLDLCPCVSPYIVGRSPVNLTSPTWHELARSVVDVEPGGTYTPPDCTARQSIVVIFPYRDREEHLRTMLRHIHPFLQRQQARYTLLVVEETTTPLFNKGLTFNAGFMEAVKRFDPDCFIFHDIDQLPEDDRHIYRCWDNPVHMDVLPSQNGYRLTYPTHAGGALAMKKDVYKTVNGYSNLYYGWGKEDDDISLRFETVPMEMMRHLHNISSYSSIRHKPNLRNSYNSKMFANRRHTDPKGDFKKEGLSTARYNVTKTIVHPLYTHVMVKGETPLFAYSKVTEAIPCMNDSISSLSASLETCATSCNELGTKCAGFVFKFAHPVPKVTCYLKAKACNKTEALPEVRFFMKHT